MAGHLVASGHPPKVREFPGLSVILTLDPRLLFEAMKIKVLETVPHTNLPALQTRHCSVFLLTVCDKTVPVFWAKISQRGKGTHTHTETHTCTHTPTSRLVFQKKSCFSIVLRPDPGKTIKSFKDLFGSFHSFSNLQVKVLIPSQYCLLKYPN